MLRNYLILFFVVCIISALATLAGSILGNSLGQKGLFIGAIIGGILGVYISCFAATKIIKAINFRSTLLGALVGFAVAALIAVNFIHYAIIAIGSVGLIGFGACIGNYIGLKNNKND
ncbi:MAG: hypothetical protein ACR2FN_02465 [Chitinophagaceae bacterium]